MNRHGLQDLTNTQQTERDRSIRLPDRGHTAVIQLKKNVVETVGNAHLVDFQCHAFHWSNKATLDQTEADEGAEEHMP